MSTTKDLLHRVSLSGRLDMVKFLVQKGSDVNAVNNDGETALHYASFHNRLDVAKFLVEAGADVNAVNSDGETALHYACLENNIEIAKFLVEAGADVNAVNSDGETALDHASSNENIDIVKFLSGSYSLKSVNTVLNVSDDYVCPICRCHDSEEVVELCGCGHRFHTQCITDWCVRVPSCPMCRAPCF